MSFRRFMIDLPVLEDKDGNLPKSLMLKPTDTQLKAMVSMTWLQIIRVMIRRLKAEASPIQTRGPMIETVKATMHKCLHDEGKSCIEEEDI
jgi:hypothetical protein